MRFSSISPDFFKLCSFDPEVLHKEGRPYLIILKLNYNNSKQDFAIPFRSNIANYIPKDQYYSLPPRFSTKKNKIHGLHYIKMFPVHKKYLQKFHVDKDVYYQKIMGIIQKNKKQIIKEAQAYLDNYQNGIIVNYSTQIAYIYQAIHDPSFVITMQEVASDSNNE